MTRQTSGHPMVSYQLGLSSGHHAHGSAARPLRPQVKDGARPRVHRLPALPAFFSTSGAVPRASISRERVPKSNTVKYKYMGYNFLTLIQTPETVDFDIIF